MSEIALYRKYRPKKFSEVVGQESVVKALEGAIKQGKIAHAYLFSGSRGTGKTSIARIFAEAIGTSPNDLNEIDAASNNGVDEIRALNEAVNTLPFESKYKIYIFDEVHMFSKGAWNAFLKTLEEPPSHVIFILATTELEKVPETIISRCQTFIFKKPNQAVLREVVLSVAKKEGFKIDVSSAELIALLGDGAFRDTLGILQKVLSSSTDKNVSAEEVEMITGAPRNSLVNDFIGSIADKKIEKGLSAVRLAAESNIDMKVYLKLILRKLRFVLLLKYSPDMISSLSAEISEEDLVFLRELSARKDSPISSATILEMLNTYDLVGHSFVPELPLELALTKLAI